MPAKKRSRLGEAELPRSLEEFLESNPNQYATSLLLDYIDELEALNRNLQERFDGIERRYKSLNENFEKRIDALELALERASGSRVIRPLTDDELREKRSGVREQAAVRRGKASGMGRKNKGWK